jgi:hypothetical protein
MSNAYDDDKYNVVERKWFRLPILAGGDAAAAFTSWATTDATKISLIKRHYFKGPVRLLKFGALNIATATNASNDVILARLVKSGATNMASVRIKNTSTAVSAYTIASIETADTTDFTVTHLDAGDYISINTATPKTDKGTAANTASTTGSYVFFIDYVRKYDADKWNEDYSHYQG